MAYHAMDPQPTSLEEGLMQEFDEELDALRERMSSRFKEVVQALREENAWLLRRLVDTAPLASHNESEAQLPRVRKDSESTVSSASAASVVPAAPNPRAGPGGAGSAAVPPSQGDCDGDGTQVQLAPQRSSPREVSFSVEPDGGPATPGITPRREQAASMGPGKSSQYVVSYRRQHSLHPEVPEQVAKNIHASMSLLGYAGLFDTDVSTEFSRDDIEAYVRRSCTVIVIMDDETAESELCRCQWESAKKYEVPVVCVVDGEHFSKESVLKCVPAECSHLLEGTWIELTIKNRRRSITELCRWLDDQMPRDNASPDITVYGSNEGHRRLLHPAFELMMVLAGVNHHSLDAEKHPLRTKLARVWALVLRALYVFMLLAQALKLMLPGGPAVFGWPLEVLLLLLLGLHLFGLRLLEVAYGGPSMRAVLSCLKGWTARERGDELFDRSRGFAAQATIVGAANSALLCILFGSSYFGAPHAEVEGHAYVFGPLALLAAILVPLHGFVLQALMTVAQQLSTIQVEVALDRVNQRIETLGLERYVGGVGEQLATSDDRLLAFRESWARTCRKHAAVQSVLKPLAVFQVAAYAYAGLLPLLWWLDADAIVVEPPSRQHWARLGAMIQLYVLASVLFPLGTLAANLQTTLSGRRLLRLTRMLTFTKVNQQTAFDSALSAFDLDWRISCMPVTPASFAVYGLLSATSVAGLVIALRG